MLDIKVLPQTVIRIKRNRGCAMLSIQNNSMESVGYKIKTTRPRDYVVRPNMGMIMPMQYAEVEVTLCKGTIPDGDHKFLVEVYQFDWRRSIGDFKQHLRVNSPRPVWTSRIGIMLEEEEEKKIEESQDRFIGLLAHAYFVLSTLCLFYRLFN